MSLRKSSCGNTRRRRECGVLLSIISRQAAQGSFCFSKRLSRNKRCIVASSCQNSCEGNLLRFRATQALAVLRPPCHGRVNHTPLYSSSNHHAATTAARAAARAAATRPSQMRHDPARRPGRAAPRSRGRNRQQEHPLRRALADHARGVARGRVAEGPPERCARRTCRPAAGRPPAPGAAPPRTPGGARAHVFTRWTEGRRARRGRRLGDGRAAVRRYLCTAEPGIK